MRRGQCASVIGPAIRGAEVAILHSKLLRGHLHPIDKSRLTARYALSKSNRRVVARKGHHTVQQVCHAHLLAGFQKHRRTLVIPCLPCFRANGEFCIGV